MHFVHILRLIIYRFKLSYSPALLTNISNLASSFKKSFTNSWMDFWLHRSRLRYTTLLLPVLCCTSSAAGMPLWVVRHAMMTRAPRRASSIAVSLPIPESPPEGKMGFVCKIVAYLDTFDISINLPKKSLMKQGFWRYHSVLIVIAWR